MHKIVDHPLINEQLTILRNKDTKSFDFAEALKKISLLIYFEIAKSFSIKNVKVKSPIAFCNSSVIDSKVIFVPILRAGLPLLELLRHYSPDAEIAHIGISRKKTTTVSTLYFSHFPKNANGKIVIILEPIIASGITLQNAIKEIKKLKPKEIVVLNVACYSNGLKEIEKTYPDVCIFTAAIDKKLNKEGYLVPGLGDAGDRIFNT